MDETNASQFVFQSFGSAARRVRDKDGRRLNSEPVPVAVNREALVIEHVGHLADDKHLLVGRRRGVRAGAASHGRVGFGRRVSHGKRPGNGKRALAEDGIRKRRSFRRTGSQGAVGKRETEGNARRETGYEKKFACGATF